MIRAASGRLLSVSRMCFLREDELRGLQRTLARPSVGSELRTQQHYNGPLRRSDGKGETNARAEAR
jgi:hypothetical protein